MSVHPRLYHELPYLWPIISAPEEYAGEAICWREVLEGELGLDRHHIHELGVGGGHNRIHLPHNFQCTAVDIYPKALPKADSRAGGRF